MLQWEKKILQFCLRKKYLSLGEFQSFILLADKSPQKNIFFLLESHLHWSKDNIKKIYQEALEHDNTMMGDNTKIEFMDTKSEIAANPNQPHCYSDLTPFFKKEVTNIYKVGRYNIIKTLGEGGMGIVYLVYDPLLQRHVALKVLSPEFATISNSNERFIRETQAVAKLNHPNIVKIYDVADTQDPIFFTMEYIKGKSLKEILEEKSLSMQELLEIFQKIVHALAHAHRQEIIHRDIKPANILVDQQNEPYVMDFGLAKIMGNSNMDMITAPGAIIGSPAYMSPEQAASELDKIGKPSDVYALGVILYEILAEKKLVEKNHLVAMFCQIIEQETCSLRTIKSEIPEELDRICLKCLQKKIASRYPSAEEMAQDLDKFLQPQKIATKTIDSISPLGVLHFQYYNPENPSDSWVSFFEVPIKQELIKIGRNRANDICIRVPDSQERSLHISGEHCQLMITKDKKMQIIDKKSTNGTFLDTQYMEPNKIYTLASGSVVDLGKKELRFIVYTAENNIPIKQDHCQKVSAAGIGKKEAKCQSIGNKKTNKVLISTTIDGAKTLEQES